MLEKKHVYMKCRVFVILMFQVMGKRFHVKEATRLLNPVPREEVQRQKGGRQDYDVSAKMSGR